uniref:Translation initiation factor beta propellor-like domain-containing protein n=1 Tax=Ascaris lumbricoides TaxID=6252 RepID=A0A9J2Q8D7_ASCLU
MMNAELLDKNFGVCFPEELDGCLDVQQGSANCCKFNRWGSMVAVGSIDGRVYIFDVITKGVVKSWMCHGYPITALSWSRDGRKLLTAATDWSVAIWDVLEGTRLERFVYGSPIISAMFNPRDEYQILVVYLSGNPVVEDVKAKQQKEVIRFPGFLFSSFVDLDIHTKIRFHGMGDDQVGDVTVATFDRRGKFIVTGTSKGRIAFYDSKTIRMITYVKQNALHQIKNIVLTRRGDFLLTNSQDRIIRTYNLNDLLKKHQGAVVEPMQKLLDIVNKASWKAICVSNDGDYICGASTKAHSLYIWERNSGCLIKMLHGTKGESLHDVQWHPTRPIILSVANGLVSVWTQAHVENWSAFAPEFTELEENAKYMEKESEFDLEDEDADEPTPHTSQDDDDEIVDVVTLKANMVYCSSDEEDDGSSYVTDLTAKNGPLWFLPISPEVENPEENPLSLLYGKLLLEALLTGDVTLITGYKMFLF